MAFEASADERDTRGFISITTSVPSSGFTPNWMFEPPVSTPISRMIAIAASRISWYSRSVSVWAGATVIESPVCTPIGSKFSIEQMMTTLSAPSRITSSSYSFQPSTLCSTRHSCARRLLQRPVDEARRSPRRGSATLPPVPPSVKLGRMIAGKPGVLHDPARVVERARVARERQLEADLLHRLAEELAVLGLVDRVELGADQPDAVAARGRPPPTGRRSRFSAVWPPSVGRIASGRSRSMIFSTLSTVIGSM